MECNSFSSNQVIFTISIWSIINNNKGYNKGYELKGYIKGYGSKLIPCFIIHSYITKDR